MKKLDLTQGNVPGVLFQFALPYLLANMLQALYGGADLFVVGQFDDAASVAGVAIGSQVMQTVTGIILGLTTGITVLIGIATGARNDKETASIIGSSIWLFALVGGFLTLLMTLLHNPIAALMHTPAEAMRDFQIGRQTIFQLPGLLIIHQKYLHIITPLFHPGIHCQTHGK